MTIQKAEIYKLALPFQQPFRTNFGELRATELIIVKLFDKNGLVGIGEGTNLKLPIYEPEFIDASMLLLENYLLPRILNKNISSIENLEKEFSSIRGFNFAKTAIEAAYWHLVSQQENKPLRELWGGTKTIIPSTVGVGLGLNLKDSIQKALEHIAALKPERLKMKIMPGIDIELIKAVRKKYPDLPLKVDANAGYTLRDKELFRELDSYNLIMIEQPLQYNDIIDHAILQKELKTPICLDESITNYHLAEQALKIDACKVINIKPARVGGYWQAKRISELAAKYDVPVWCGGMIESGWGQLFNCAIATLPNFLYENDIDLTKWYLTADILDSPIQEVNGTIDVAATDILFKIDEKKLKKYTLAHKIISS